MTCPRCQGLMVRDEEDSLRCMNCSRRVYGRVSMTMEETRASAQALAEQPSSAGPRRCQGRRGRGTCRTDADTNGYCTEHQGQSRQSLASGLDTDEGHAKLKSKMSAEARLKISESIKQRHREKGHTMKEVATVPRAESMRRASAITLAEPVVVNGHDAVADTAVAEIDACLARMDEERATLLRAKNILCRGVYT